MLTKEKIRTTIDNLPDEGFSIDEIVERLIILDKVEQGLQDVKDGNVLTTGEVREKLERWLK
jgi:predicted transcriptional regulator